MVLVEHDYSPLFYNTMPARSIVENHLHASDLEMPCALSLIQVEENDQPPDEKNSRKKRPMRSHQSLK
jgi:hypothetical protein